MRYKCLNVAHACFKNDKNNRDYLILKNLILTTSHLQARQIDILKHILIYIYSSIYLYIDSIVSPMTFSIVSAGNNTLNFPSTLTWLTLISAIGHWLPSVHRVSVKCENVTYVNPIHTQNYGGFVTTTATCRHDCSVA
jgi:hypothetical protein